VRDFSLAFAFWVVFLLIFWLASLLVFSLGLAPDRGRALAQVRDPSHTFVQALAFALTSTSTSTREREIVRVGECESARA
jgi:hypothetical protein